MAQANGLERILCGGIPIGYSIDYQQIQQDGGRDALIVVNGRRYQAISRSGADSSVTTTNDHQYQFTSGLRGSFLRLPSDKVVACNDYAYVGSITPLATLGLKLVDADLVYNDGDQLTAKFRIYCPTKQIRPTDFRLMRGVNEVLKEGKQWETSFSPRYGAEWDLVSQSCK